MEIIQHYYFDILGKSHGGTPSLPKCTRFSEMIEKRRGDSQNRKGRERVLRERAV